MDTHTIKRDIAQILTFTDNRVAQIGGTPDISPRFEAVIFPVYIGVWLYQDDDQRRFSVEIDSVKDESNWLEDGVQRDETVEHTYYANFTDAMTAVNKVVTHLSNLEYFNNV
jgi:hypothetical protein